MEYDEWGREIKKDKEKPVIVNSKRGFTKPKTYVWVRKFYQTSELKPGDSYFVECGDEDVTAARSRIYACIKHASKGNKKKFRTRKREGGIRVWRKS